MLCEATALLFLLFGGGRGQGIWDDVDFFLSISVWPFSIH